ncbi:endonuclease/exonuclease/phosphatase family protein [Streptomyces sp. NPDC048518]|uniref:endonuclease/exonuclease/phosphatase family protein n=1 Tax=Streptomyces sp. NPDC048518 TaxID=3155029 RepID=UPI0033FEB49F
MTQVKTVEAGQSGATDTGATDTGATGTGATGTGLTDPGAPGTGADRSRSRWWAPLTALTRPGPWRRGLVLATLALALGLLLLLHAQLTDRGGIGSLVETFLPWFGLFVPVLLAAALWRRSASAVIALLVPAVAWLSLFGGLLGDKSHPAGDLTVVSHNVGAENPDPTGTARDLATSGADVLALEEISSQARGTYEKELATTYPHHAVRGTVGLWSKRPLSEIRTVDVAMQGMVGPLAEHLTAEERKATPRALRATVATDRGPLAVYVAHLGSVRVNPESGFVTGQRDAGARSLAKTIAAERNERVVLLGDLNGTMDDRAFDGVTAQLDSAQEKAGDGFGFSWPAKFPMARIDQILVRGVEPASSWVLPATGSDHLPVAAGLDW